MAKRKRIYGKRRRKSPFKINEERKIELQEKIKVLKSEGKSPEEIKQIMKKETKGKAMDRLQTKLSFLGVAFPPADAVNALLSAGRAGHAKLTGNEESYKKHGEAGLWNLAAIVPGVGEAKKVSDIAKGADKVIDATRLAGQAGYWAGTGQQILEDIDPKGKIKNFAQKIKNKYGI